MSGRVVRQAGQLANVQHAQPRRGATRLPAGINPFVTLAVTLSDFGEMPKAAFKPQAFDYIGVPEGTRTPDLRFRKPPVAYVYACFYISVDAYFE
jgi:hypothetical protein